MNIPSLTARRPDRKNSIGSVTVSLLLHALIFLGMMHTSEAFRLPDQLLVVNLAYLSAGGSGSGSPEGGGQGDAAAFPDEPEPSSPASFQSEPLPEPVPIAPPEPIPEQDSLAPVTADRDAVPVVRPDAEKKRVETKPEAMHKPEPAKKKRTTAKKEPVKSEEVERQEDFSTARVEGSGNALVGIPGPGKETAPYGTGGGKNGGSGGNASSAGGSAKGYIRANFAYIQRHIRQHLEYPRQARMLFQSGVAHYSFVVEKSGKVSSLRLIKSSGFPLLDKAGEKAISDASPLPAPPEPARITMPISFTLK